MATFAITFILFTIFLIPFRNCVYVPNGQYSIPNGGNQLIGSAGGGGLPSASSTIQNGKRDLPNGQYFIPNGGNQLTGSAGSSGLPSASSTIQNGPRDLPNGQYSIPNGGNQLTGSAGGGGLPSTSSTIQNGPRDLPNGQYFIPNGGNQLIGAAGGGGLPSVSSTIPNGPRDTPYYVPQNQQPRYRSGIIGPGAGSVPLPNKYAAYPTESGLTNPTITVNSFNTAVSTNSDEPSSTQVAEQGTTLEDF